MTLMLNYEESQMMMSSKSKVHGLHGIRKCGLWQHIINQLNSYGRPIVTVPDTRKLVGDRIAKARQ